MWAFVCLICNICCKFEALRYLLGVEFNFNFFVLFGKKIYCTVRPFFIGND